MTLLDPTRRRLLQCVPIVLGAGSQIDVAQAAENLSAEGWPMAQYDKKRTSSSDVLEAPGPQLETEWSRNLSDPVGDIMAVDGTVFATILGSTDGLALNAETGEGIWSGPIETYHNGYIYGQNSYYGDTIHQIDPSNGEIRWSKTVETGSSEYVSRLIGNRDSIIVALKKDGSQRTGSLHSISIDDQRQQWVHDRVSVGGMAIADGSVYFADYAGPISLHSIDLNDGTSNWDIEVNSFDVGTPTVQGNTIYLPNSDADLMAFGANLGTKKWEFNTPDDNFGSPAVTDEYVVSPLGEGVFCLSQDMGINWEFQVEEDWAPVGGVAVVRDKVYFGARDGNFYVLDLHTGEELNRFETDSEIVGSPAIAYNKVYFGTEDGTVYALTDQPNKRPDPDFSYSPRNPRVDTEVTFDASESTDDRSIVEYDWTFGNSNLEPDTGEIVSKVFETPGRKDVKLTVTDDQDTSATISKSVDVVRANQVPEAIISHSPNEPEIGDSVTFEGTASSDPDGMIEKYEWDIDQDPNSGYHIDGDVVEYSFESPGDKNVKLRVTDDDGLEASTEKQVTVVRQQVNFEFTGTQTEITLDEDAIITLSIVNYLSNKEVTVQLVINTPSGISVSSVAGADSGSNQYNAVETIDPASQSSISIRLAANEPGEFDVGGIAIWYRGDDEDDVNRYTDSVTIRAQSEGGSADRGDQNGDPTSSEAPGFGIGTALGGVAGSSALIKWLHDRRPRE